MSFTFDDPAIDQNLDTTPDVTGNNDDTGNPPMNTFENTPPGSAGPLDDLSTPAGVPFDQFPQHGAQKGEPSVANATAGIPGYDTGVPSGLPNATDSRWSKGNVPAPGNPTDFAGNVIADFSPSGNHALPNPGTGGPPSTGGSGQLSDADWEARFKAENGYYDPRYNSRDSFLANAQRGDQAIRGVTGGGDQLADMAKYDSDAKRIYDAIHGTPDFYHSQNAADWVGQHNTEVANRLAQFGAQPGEPPAAGGAGFNGGLGKTGLPQRGAAPGGANIAAMDALRRQEIAPVGSPIDNAHSLVTQQLEKALVDSLASLGATGFKQTFDPYGNMTLDYTSAGGTPQKITRSFVDYASALDELKNRVSAQQAALQQATAPASGGGGYAPRGGYAARGGGGGGGGGSYVDPYASQRLANGNAIAERAFNRQQPGDWGVAGYGNDNGVVSPSGAAGVGDWGGGGGGVAGYGNDNGVVSPSGAAGVGDWGNPPPVNSNEDWLRIARERGFIR